MAVLTTCPFCSVGCGLYLSAAEGSLTGVAPSESHPVSRGRLCARGWAAHEAAAWGERLTRPLVRRDGRLVPVPWAEALERAASGIRETLAAEGGIGVLGSALATNQENYLAVKLARGACGIPDVDSTLRSSYEPLVRGLLECGAALPSPGALDQLECCDAVLLVEGDVAGSHPRVASSLLRVVRGGGRLFTLGHVRTQLSRAATLHLPIRPGRERERIEDLAAVGTPAGAASERPAERLLAAHLAGASRPAVVVGPLAAPPEELRELGRALVELLASLGRPPAQVLWLPLPVRGNLRGACEAGVAPDWLPGWQPLGREGLRRMGAAWGAEPCAIPGADAATIVAERAGVVMIGEDPSATLPRGEAALASLASLRFLVALGAFASRATELAHVVLPTAAFPETQGTLTSFEGRRLPVRPCLPPPGLARCGWQVLGDLIERLGPACHCPQTFEELEGEMAAAFPASVATTGAASPRVPTPAARPPAGDEALVLALDGPFDWGSDPLVRFSPTLRREHVSRRRLFPGGLLELSAQDADRLSLRAGQRLRLTSAWGEAVLPFARRADIEPGVVLVPFAFRERVAAVTDGRFRVEVSLAPA